MNFALLIVALLFFINPSVAVFDLLPDFFAWLIILKLLERVRYLSIKMNIAAEYVLKMAWVGFGRIAAFFLIPYVDGTMELTLTFVFCVMELVWGILAIKAMFGGITELSELYGGAAAYRPVYKLKSEGIRTAQNITLWFWSLKSALNLLPEFFELTGQSSDILSEGVRPLITFKPLAYYFTLSITLALGIVLVILVIPFFKRIYADTPMLERISAAYKEKLVDTGIHNARRLIGSLMLITVAGLFVFGLMLDSMNVMPRLLFPVLILFSMKGIKPSGYKTVGITAVSLVAFVLSAISYICRWVFVIRHGYYSISQSFEAYDMFVMTGAVVIAEMISFAVLYVLTVRLIVNIAKDNNVPNTNGDYRVGAYEARELKIVRVKSITAMILFIIGAIVKSDSFVLYGSFSEIWIIVLIVDLVWFLLSYSLYNDVKERIENKYLI